MADETETAWDEINPPMASAPQQGPRSLSSGLVPATKEQFAVELASCLALVAPVGMTEEAKRDWLKVAWETLKHLPADVLSRSCKVARETCDHPSKIVPAILDASRESMRVRRYAAEWEGGAKQLPPPDYCTPEQASAILEEFGLKRKTAD